MCRNIKPLFNYDPPATEEEIRLSSLQFVRKISGFTNPSKANGAAFDTAVDEIAGIARRLIDTLTTQAPARSREQEEARRKAAAAERFGETPGRGEELHGAGPGDSRSGGISDDGR